MSESNILGFVRHYLRKASSRWQPIYSTRLRCRRQYTGPVKNRKYEYGCERCGNYFPSTGVEVHHLIPVGSLRTFDDLPGFVARLFCGAEHLKLLCKQCHKMV